MPIFCSGLQLTNYQRWFKKMVPMWLKVALVACKEKIDKAIEEDKACGHIVANILIIRMFGNFSYASYQGVLCFILELFIM